MDTKVNLSIMADPGDGIRDLEEVDVSLEEITILDVDQDDLLVGEELQDGTRDQATSPNHMENKRGKKGH